MRKNTKILAFILCAALLSAFLPLTVSAASDVVASGKCGENVNWTLDKDGVLTLSGTGDTYDYHYEFEDDDEYGPEEESDCPFFEKKHLAKRIAIGDGVTAIGSGLFAGCWSAQSVEIPDSVTRIGDRAFCNCFYHLDVDSLPDSIRTIGDEAFRSCYALDIDGIPDGVRKIGAGAFLNCISLDDIVLPSSVTELGANAFPRKTVILYTGSEAQWSALTAELEDAGEIVAVCGYVPGDPVPAVVVAQGACGGSVEWTYYNDGLLEISGTGKMYDYNCYYDEDEGDRTFNQPYAAYLPDVRRIEVRSGVTGIGKDAFYFSNAEEIVIEEGVETIGNCAFACCEKLKTISFPASLKTVGFDLFCYTYVADVYYGGSETEWNALINDKGLFSDIWYVEHPVTMHFGAEDAPEESDGQTNGIAQFFRRIADFFKRILDFFKGLFGKK